MNGGKDIRGNFTNHIKLTTCSKYSKKALIQQVFTRCLLIYMLLLLAFQLFHQTGGKLRTETGRLYIATQRGEEKQRKRNRIYWTVASGFLLSKLSFVLSLLYIHVYSSLSSHLQTIWTDCMLCLGRDLDGHSSFEPHCWEVDDDVPLCHPPTTEIHPFKQQ